MPLNKDEPHIVAIPLKENRDDLKLRILAQLPDNLVKYITAERLRDVVNTMVDSLINIVDDNMDLRAHNEESFVLGDAVVGGSGELTFTLAHDVVNPSEQGIFFTMDGVAQELGPDFTVAANTVTFFADPEVPFDANHRFHAKYRYFL